MAVNNVASNMVSGIAGQSNNVKNVSSNSTDQATFEKYLEMQMMTQIFKQSVGNSQAGQVALESLSQALMGSGGDLSGLQALGLGTSDLSSLGYSNNTSSYSANAISSYGKANLGTSNTSINDAVTRAANKYGVDKNLIMAVIKQESSFDPNATSSAGAMGLMQLMPGTAQELGVSNPYDVAQNVDGGTKYLKQLLDSFGNSKELALAAYNAGPNALRSKGVNNIAGISKLPAETRDYVQKIMASCTA